MSRKRQVSKQQKVRCKRCRRTYTAKGILTHECVEEHRLERE